MMVKWQSRLEISDCLEMLSSFIKQASGDVEPQDKRAQKMQHNNDSKYDAVSASRSILSSYLSIASETGGGKKTMASDQFKGGERTGGLSSFSRGGGTGWRNFVGAFDDDEFVNTAPVGDAPNVRKSTHVVDRPPVDRDASSPESVRSFRMPEPLYSPLTPSSNQPLRLHVGELDEPTKPLSASIGLFHGSLKAADSQFVSKRVAFEPLQHAPPAQDSAIITATEQLQERVVQLTKQCEDHESTMRGLIQAHADEIGLIRAEADMFASENTRLRLEVSELQNGRAELEDAGDALRRMNDGLQLQLAELAGSAKSRDAIAADTRAQLEHIYRSRIDLLQREVSELNLKLIAAASRPQHDDSAEEWAPYFQAAQRDHAQKIQELNATHAADLRLLQEAKDRERTLWEREIDAALSHVKALEEKQRNQAARSEERLKQLQEAHDSEMKQLHDAHNAQLSSASGRAAEAVRRADVLQAKADELQTKCKQLESQLQAARQSADEAAKESAARELLVRRQAEAEASQMYRQLKNEHEENIKALQQKLTNESSAVAAERVALSSVLRELDASHSAQAAALSEKDRIIAAKQSELVEAEARLVSQKQRVEDEKAAAATMHAQALRTQEAAHSASIEALQATYDLQLRQLRATSQGAIESVGKSQDALASVLDSRLADLQRHHREEMAQVVGSHSRQMQQMQRDMEAQERAHAFQLEELKREMIADVGMLQATHMQEMSTAHERALAAVAAAAPIAQPPDLEPKVALHVVSSGLSRMKHSCVLARASCRMATDALRSLSTEVVSGLACAVDAISLIQQQWQHEQQLWKQRHDVQISGQILAQSVEMLQENHRQQPQQKQLDTDTQMQPHREHHLQEDQSRNERVHIFNQHIHGPSQMSPHSLMEQGSESENNHSSSRHDRHVRFMLADGPHQPGVSPAPPPHPPVHGVRSTAATNTQNYHNNRSAQNDDDSLDESQGGEGSGSLQSYLGEGRGQSTSADDSSDEGIKFAQLWPPHQLPSLPAASAATLNILMQPHSPATIANHLISHARGSAANALHAKSSPVSAKGSPRAASVSPSSAAEPSSGDTGAEFEMRARELYGDYVWMVQKTQATDEIGQSIQADELAEREWSSGTDGEQLAGASAATSLLVSSSGDGDMLLQPRMTQLLATLVPAMFEAWNKAEVSYVHRKATCRALASMTAGDKIARMEAEVRSSCDLLQKASTELECMRAREALKRRCAILNTRIDSLQASLSSLDVRALSERAHVTATIRSLAKQRTSAAAEKKRLTGVLSLMAPNWQLKHQRPLLYRGIDYSKILQRDKRCEDSLAANKMVNSIKARAKRAL